MDDEFLRGFVCGTVTTASLVIWVVLFLTTDSTVGTLLGIALYAGFVFCVIWYIRHRSDRHDHQAHREPHGP